jgi:hypothetical protein
MTESAPMQPKPLPGGLRSPWTGGNGSRPIPAAGFETSAVRLSHARGGHDAKIAEALKALRAAGQLPPLLGAVQRDHRILRWLMQAGYAQDLPSRWAIRRAIEREAHS